MRNIKKEFILYRSIVDTIKPRELSYSHIIVKIWVNSIRNNTYGYWIGEDPCHIGDFL